MTAPTSFFRHYFRVILGEPPTPEQLNAGLVDKIDTDMNAALVGAALAESDVLALKTRVDAHADGAGNLTAAPPEFTVFGSPPTFIANDQFSVDGDFSSMFTVDRAVMAVLTSTTPVSQIKVSVYDGGSDRTIVTLFDGILDSSVSQVKLGFLQKGMPKVPESGLDFDVATQAELDAHKASGDHDASYISKTLTTLQNMLGNLRMKRAGEARVELEDSTQIDGNFRVGRIRQVGQTWVMELEKGDGSAQKVFVTFDAANSKSILGQNLDANSKSITNLAAPGGANDAARSVDIPPHADTNPSTIAFGDAPDIGATGKYADQAHRHGAPASATTQSIFGSRGQSSRNNAGTPNTQYDLNADFINLFNPSTFQSAVIASPATVTADITTAGPAANGRDQAGAFANNIWIHFYWIWDGATLASIASTVAPPTGPTLPGGYTHWSYAGAVRYTTTLRKTRIKGNRAFVEAAVQVLAVGTATAETAVSVSAAVPPNAPSYEINLSDNRAGSNRTLKFRVISGADFITLTNNSGSNQTVFTTGTLPNISQQFFYIWSSGPSTGVSIDVISYALPNGG